MQTGAGTELSSFATIERSLRKLAKLPFTIQQLISAFVPLQPITDKYENVRIDNVCPM